MSVVRNVWCERYSECLNKAANGKHGAFDCADCPLEDDMSAKRDVTDIFAIGLLMASIFYPDMETKISKSKKTLRRWSQLRALLTDLDRVCGVS